MGPDVLKVYQRPQGFRLAAATGSAPAKVMYSARRAHAGPARAGPLRAYFSPR